VAVAVETIIDKAILEDVEFEDDGQKLLFVVPMDVPEKASENSDVCHEYFTNTVKELEDYGVFAEVC
jgi:pectin methylesterase-like acyl-CoA thioesterase